MARISPTLVRAFLIGALAAPAACGGSAAATTLARQQTPQTFNWSGVVASGRSVEIKGVNGAIRAERASGNQVQVEAVKRGRRSDPTSVTVEIVEHAGGVTLCAVYPSPAGQRANECAAGSGGRMNTRNNDVEVEFTVRVPDGVHLVARTVNGAVEAEGLRGNVDVTTTNGGIFVSTTGQARGTTTNGRIDVEMGALRGTEDYVFRTTNGDISLTVNGSLDADVEARTTNGSFSSDFPLTVQGRFGPRSVQGVVGSGGPRLVLQTTNGDVSLRRSAR